MPPTSDLPTTRYARAGDVSIAYQTMGDAPLDLILVPGLVSHVEFGHELPGYTDFLRRLAAFARVTTFDKRGQGLSDRVAGVASLEERMDDLKAVMTALGVERAVLMGYSEGGSMAALYTATFPERVSRLIIYASMARFTRADDYPHMPTLDEIRRSVRHWGTGASIKSFAPSLAGDPEAMRLQARVERMCASPGAYHDMLEANASIDVRAVLPQIRRPTLVLHHSGGRMVPVGNGRYFAEHIPGARYIEYPGGDHRPWAPEHAEQLVADVRSFVTGRRERVEESAGRALATVLFTDIVDSTARAAALGDAAWRQVLDAYEAAAARQVATYRGRIVKTTGDGVLATFDGPGRAVRCALALGVEARALGIESRAGLHTGEVETRGADIAGIAVNVAARIMGEAAPGEALVSRIATDLAAGAGLVFAERPPVELRGVPGLWSLFAARSG